MLVAALLAASLTGCSGAQLAYNHVDLLVRLQANRYLDLTDEQRRWLAAEIDAQHAWHRKTQLPQYVVALRGLARRAAERPIAAADLAAVEAQVRGWADNLTVQWTPVAGRLLLLADSRQIAHLREALGAQNEDDLAEDRSLSPAQRTGKLRKRLVESYELSLGELTPTQQAAIDAAAQRLRPDREAWIEYRRRWQNDLLELLARRRTAPGCFVAEFVRMSRERERWYSPEYRAIETYNANVNRELGATVFAAATAAQRQHLADKLREWALLMDELARQPANVVADTQPARLDNACSDTAMTAHGVVPAGS